MKPIIFPFPKNHLQNTPNLKASFHSTRPLFPSFSMALLFLLLAQAVAGQQLSRTMHGVNLKRSHSFLNHPPSPEILALWIDGKQVENITGIFMEVDIIRRGIVNYELNNIRQNDLPILPYYVDHVELTWLAEKETFRYSFSKMMSLNPDILWDPLLSIPSSGNVPKHQSVFEIAIPCTKNVSALAGLYVELNITNSMYQPIPGSPLKFRIKKQCYGTNVSCHCKNGGRCLEGGLCRCESDSYGQRCQFKTGRCGYSCKNGGACNQFNTCSCPEGYVGKFCQIPVCREDCGRNQVCVAPETCDCRPWYKRPNCTTKSHGYHERKMVNKHKKTRKQRQSDASQKENPSKSWKNMKKAQFDIENNVQFRHPTRKNHKKIKILSDDYSRIRRNNRYNYKNNYQNYRKRSNYDRNYNYNKNYNQPSKNKNRSRVNNNIHNNNVHNNNIHKKRMKGYPINNNLRKDNSNTDIDNKANYNIHYNDEYNRKSSYDPRYNSNIINNKKMRLKVKRLRAKKTARKDGVLRLNKGANKHKYKRKAKAYNYADNSLNVNNMNKKKLIKKRKRGQVRSAPSNHVNKNKINLINNQLYVNAKKSTRGSKRDLRKKRIGRLVRQVLTNDRQ